jgi:hypothetical protein
MRTILNIGRVYHCSLAGTNTNAREALWQQDLKGVLRNDVWGDGRRAKPPFRMQRTGRGGLPRLVLALGRRVIYSTPDT